MTDPQDACSSCGHARHLHYPDTCVFARDTPGGFCQCPGFVEDPLAELGVEVREATRGEQRDALERAARNPRRTLGRTGRPLRAPPREPPLLPERVAEIKSELAEMRAVQTRIYHVGLKMPHGEWQAFAALVSVFASMCEIVLEQGYDYAFEAECAVVPEFKAKYLGEKFRRVFGPFYGNPGWIDAFLTEAGLKR